MEEQENQENQENEIQNKLAEIKTDISGRAMKIKLILDNLVTALQKEKMTEADLSAAFDLVDAMQDESEETVMLLFDIKELLKL